MNARLPMFLRVLGGRLGEQWERERRDTLFLMAATLLSAIGHFRHLPLWATIAFLSLFAWRLGLVMSGRYLPRDSVRWVAAIACTAGVYASYGTLIGRDSGVALLVLFLGLKLMEMQARRDLHVVLFLCFFMLLTTFFYSQSLPTALLSLATVLTLIACLITMEFGQREAPINQRFRFAGSLLLQAAPIALALFFLFPRLDSPLWGAPSDGGMGQTGLSESMAPGNIGSLTKSEQVVMRVKFEAGAPLPAQMYWRGPVFGDFDGRTWRPLSAPVAAPPQARIEVSDKARPIRYSVTLEPMPKAWLMALEAPTDVFDLPAGQALMGPDMVMLASQPARGRIRYTVESHLDYRLGRNETTLSRQNWLELPPGFNPRTLGLAAQWRSEENDPAKLVQRAMTMFREQEFRYTLQPPVLGKHSVDEFLFSTRAGFCEHFSGAFVVLMRALDIPARIVTGYQGAEHNPVDDYWIVRQADAHAWAEVWFADKGWVRIDPVTAVAPQRIERGSRALQGQAGIERVMELGMMARWRLNLDAITNGWNQWVLSYNGDRQRRMFSNFGIDFQDWGRLAAIIGVVLACLLGVAALITLRPRRANDPVERAWQDFCERLAATGLQRLPHETGLDYFSRIQPALEPEMWASARRIVDAYNRLRYSDTQYEAKAIRALQFQVHRFKP